jgi:hypothetical protein
MANGATVSPAQKWLAAMQSPNTVANYTSGVNATTQSPMAAAAQALPQYLAGVTDAVNSGRMAAALNATPLSAWANGCTGKGAQRLSSGAQAAAPKVTAFFTKWTPIFSQISNSVKAMPKGGMANAMARVSAVYTALKQAAGKSVN